MPTFMEEMHKLNTPESKMTATSAQIEQNVKSDVKYAIEAITSYIKHNYNDRSFSGYIGEASYDNCKLVSEASRDYKEIIKERNKKGYSSLTYYEKDRIKDRLKLHRDLMRIDDDEKTVFEKMLTEEIRKLGIKDFSIDFEHHLEYERQMRDLLSWAKYRSTGKYYYIIHLKMKW